MYSTKIIHVQQEESYLAINGQIGNLHVIFNQFSLDNITRRVF